MKNRAPTLTVFALAASLAGCATTGEPNPRDPLEPMNRAIFTFNDSVDKAVFKPLAKGYKAVTPTPVQNGVRNVFSNLDDVTEFANNLLQFKIQAASSDLMRVAVNSTFGFLGLFDIASEMRLPKHNEDFGQTLGRWGFHSGPYLVLPLLGSSSFRDGVGLAVDSNYLDPIYKIKHIASRNDALAVKSISRRADLLDASNILEEAALDKYDYTRDFYLERRRGLVYDGHPPPEPDDAE
ncbi:MAG TPA: VacJ family lipoprotein [Parasulfuritortus sp.]